MVRSIAFANQDQQLYDQHKIDYMIVNIAIYEKSEVKILLPK
jgi:hypothetical protein